MQKIHILCFADFVLISIYKREKQRRILIESTPSKGVFFYAKKPSEKNFEILKKSNGH